MRHSVDGRKFGRNTSHRVAMFRNMANQVVMLEQVITTVEKAKEIRRVVDRLITLGKGGADYQRRLAFDRTRDNEVVQKLFSTLADRYKSRNGGYTRVLKMSDQRRGDGAKMAVLELVDKMEISRKRKPKENKKGQEEESGKQAASASPDPMGKFKKLFRGKSKVTKSSGAQNVKRQARPAKIAPSGGGKQGGSSSS